MKSALVIGGSGFLGSHVADALTDKSYGVKIFDQEASPYLQPNQEMILGDLLDQQALMEAAAGCDVVYNFAGLADIDEASNKPVDTIKLNVLGNTYALQAAVEAEVKQFIFASSLYVLSNTGSFYRASKQSAEHIVKAYHERYGLNYTVLRYGTLYGRRADKRNSIYRYLR